MTRYLVHNHLIIAFSILFGIALHIVDFVLAHTQAQGKMPLYGNMKCIEANMLILKTKFQEYQPTCMNRSMLEGCGINTLWKSFPAFFYNSQQMKMVFYHFDIILLSMWMMVFYQDHQMTFVARLLRRFIDIFVNMGN